MEPLIITLIEQHVVIHDIPRYFDTCTIAQDALPPMCMEPFFGIGSSLLASCAPRGLVFVSLSALAGFVFFLEHLAVRLV